MDILTVEKQQFEVINPSNGKIVTTIPDASAADMEKAIVIARQAFDQGLWPRMSIAERGIYLKKIASLIRQHAKELADLESASCGKTTKQVTFIDVPTCADTFEYFGSIGEQFETRENKVAAAVKSQTVWEPIGVVGCIIPWNYPLIMSAWKMAPALITGNTVILKPSKFGCTAVMRLAEIIKESDLPKGVVNIIATTNHSVAEILLKDKRVDMISFTGGTKTGQDVMRLASTTTKKVSLELGGKSPNIAFADCDIEAAIGGTMSSIFMNQGQMCTAMSRLLIEEKIYDQFLEKLVTKTCALKIGPCNDPTTDFGPLISKEQQEKITRYVEIGKEEGATVACGGKIPSGKEFQNGFYYEPTILVNVNNKMRIAQEEIFGPVLCVMKFKTEEQAVQIANDSPYGLAACVWTKDLEKANKIAKQLQAGTVWINTYGGFYNEASFGGYKQSGFGRELGIEGLLEYTQSKNICMDQTPGGKPLAASWF